MSLYRKYRPQTFAEVVGQDAVVTTLEQAAEQDKLAHAFLFAGSRGTGKTSVARILAKVLMTNGIQDEIIRKQIIKGVEEGNIVDLLEIDAASNRGIDDVRDLIEKIQFSPVVASTKVYIIDEVHMLTKEAFNALLKTLEEPPSYAFFILATTELNKIPATIQSRCQCFPFRRIPEEDIIRRLQFIADQEHITIEREALRSIAHHAQGGMRDAISMIDQIRTLPKITAEDVEQNMGKTGSEYLEPLFVAIDNHDSKEIIEIVRKIEEAGIALDVFLRMLLNTTREMLHEAIEKNQSTQFLQHILDKFLKAIRDVRIAPVPGLILESALLSLCSPLEEAPSAELKTGKKDKERLSRPKEEEPQKHKKGKEEISKEVENEEVQNEPAQEVGKELKEASVEAVELNLENLKELWPQIVNETSPAPVKMSLKNAELISVNDKTLTVGFTSSFHKDKVANTEASRKIEEVMNKILRHSLKLVCVIGDGVPVNEQPQPDVDLAEAAAEIF
ncbi:DNA polymerase III subunit gamma/tau [Patescibacteria group bacterium]|nr:DNA polymerase III subunit gamma/tau [Patescibacteria group bacterium]